MRYILILLSFLTFSLSLAAGGLKVSKFKEPKSSHVPENKIPLIFHKDYDISLLGLEKLHPFDSCKYGKVHQYLTTNMGLSKSCCHTPSIISEQDLLKVHTQAYLDSLSDSSCIAHITEIGSLSYIPNFLLQKYLLYPMKLATGGTVLGAELALKQGWAINLGGGYHHAKSNCGGGFCAYADIPLAITKTFEANPDHRVMIVDLDAHQGNGHEAFFIHEKRVTIFDIYNADIYPHDYAAQKRIDFNLPVHSGIADNEYLSLLKQELIPALDTIRPTLIIYNAGTDIFQEDPLGRMKISAEGIIARDAFIFEQAHIRNIPILMVLSGGYTKKSADVIGKSIENILKNILHII